jgi:hypothetical protein
MERSPGIEMELPRTIIALELQSMTTTMPLRPIIITMELSCTTALELQHIRTTTRTLTLALPLVVVETM